MSRCLSNCQLKSSSVSNKNSFTRTSCINSKDFSNSGNGNPNTSTSSTRFKTCHMPLSCLISCSTWARSNFGRVIESTVNLTMWLKSTSFAKVNTILALRWTRKSYTSLDSQRAPWSAGLSAAMRKGAVITTGHGRLSRHTFLGKSTGNL